MTESLMTARDVADSFGFPSPAWVLRQCRAHTPAGTPVADPLPHFRLGGTFGPVRFRASEVEAWLRRRHSAAARRAS
jgi:hypothetical protein